MTSTITETVRNGVDTATLFATLDAIKAQPEIAAFQFRAQNRWIDGAHNRSTDQGLLRGLRRGHQPHRRLGPRRRRAGDPARHRHRPQPGRIPAARACRLRHHLAGLRRRRPRCAASPRWNPTLEGDLDVQGAMGLDDDYRNGFEQIRMTVQIAGDAPEEKLRTIVQRGTDRSVVFDSITNGVPITVDVITD